MGRASAKVVLGGPISEAESLWYDHSRWPAFVEGFAHVVKLEGDWPRPGSRVVWDSARDGRGRVVERVVTFEPRVGQTVEVEDPKLRGTQRVAFEARDGETIGVSLELEYKLKEPGFGGSLVDLLFIRRALGDSLRRTLTRFGRELEAERELKL
jgi:uncharacterized membrane protein